MISSCIKLYLNYRQFFVVIDTVMYPRCISTTLTSFLHVITEKHITNSNIKRRAMLLSGYHNILYNIYVTITLCDNFG